MAASSSSSSSSSSSFSPSSSLSPPEPRPPLPVAALRAKIVEKIRENRVTLIVGDAGCGKSSQVPQYLLEENIEPILCTQPRRFAVVAIARMVAQARSCEVGGEVGYHIGHSNVSDINSRSRIVFKTAGVLLEQMRDKGMAALKYKVIILDEVHERSVESDLVLACVKQFMMKNKDLRVVLMSATADITRYRDYFKDLGRGERVEVIAIPSAPQSNIFQRKVWYLGQVADLLGKSSESLSTRYCSGTNPFYSSVDIEHEEHQLIHSLVLHIHKEEPDIEKSILIFLPTYHALERQWVLLRPLFSLLKVHILHRSIDTDQALLAMKVYKSHRKVILATNIAESSVTIPGVAYVIDSCRSLQVFWDHNRKADSTELVWVSKSQAEQRKGRTGRTCDGQVYRLVPRTFYNNLNDHEDPAILRLSLREQVLTICCAESKAINDPKVLLQRVMDPPDPEVVEDALDLLVHIHALDKPLPPRGRFEPTFHGRLLDSLPMSFDASALTLKFGEIGLLHEGILLGILLDILPLPIFRPFGDPALYAKFVDNYFQDESGSFLTRKKEAIFMANLCAFQFWQRVFKDKHRLEQLKQIVSVANSKAPHGLIAEIEEEWCKFHNLVQTSLHTISDIYEDAITMMHRFRPAFLAKVEPPSYFEPYAFEHTCLQSGLSELIEDMDLLTVGDDENLDLLSQKRCLAAPYVSPSHFLATSIFEKLQAIVKEIKVQHGVDARPILDEIINGAAFLPAAELPTTEAIICRFFAQGLCTKGDDCYFSHSVQAKRPLCKFFLTLQGCRNGDSCFFLHDYRPRIPSITAGPCLQERNRASRNSFLQLLLVNSDEKILILNDTDLSFTSNLSSHFDPSKIIAATPIPYSSQSEVLSKGIRILWNVSNPCHLIISDNGKVPPILWDKSKCVLWFADVEVSRASKELLQNLFEHLAVRILADTLYDLRLILIMNNTVFALLQVEKLARECFFFLGQSIPFDESSFGNFSGYHRSVRPKQVSAPFAYVFNMHPPTKIQFGNYSSELHKALYRM
ncbi:zinc finger CCCH domain-containing protein 4 isoform X2 [Ananas comosus]|uniref:Zinc finger CCCH domain-containing protein 4 isoform X2 n=1 Tax=Ananas comosus TaxID=4615 RepID=A0A6P5G3M1_ANACO|nr:zinc finger CCCH domain-containing protein 4 isoform X2 [Ananas comosus]